jgi:hypothetical protein
MVEAKKTKTKKETTKKASAPPKSEKTEQKSSESTEEKIKKVGDKISEVADKGMDVLKDVFEKVKDFSTDAAELTKLKVEISNYKNDRKKMYQAMGEKLWDLKKSNKFSGIETAFDEEFEKITALEKKIAQKEKEASKISL